ncbi:hypothetical protein DL96DRAFT_1585727 [Flagelloscypha sp. PMI_526]|nr:hypothetical protein DL96DRAFT_1585727 [Flagelloscypha sp. PMI_526]
MPAIALADISALDYLLKPNNWTPRLGTLCYEVDNDAPRETGIVPDMLEYLEQASKASLRPSSVTGAFLREATSDLQERVDTLEEIIKGIERSRDWLLQHQGDLDITRNVVGTLQTKPLYSFPPFPIDVGQLIIEFAVRLDSHNWHTLSLVSKQIQSWADTVFFKVLKFVTDDHMSFLTGSLSLRFRTAMAETTTLICNPSNTYMHMDCGRIFTLLDQFPMLLNLSLWDITDVEATFDLPPELRRLSCPAHYFRVNSLQFDQPGLRHLTHLDIGTTLDPYRGFRGIEQLICLTHLRLTFRDWELEGKIDTCKQLVQYMPPKLILTVIVMGYFSAWHWPLIGDFATGRVHPSFVVETFETLDIPGSEWLSVIPRWSVDESLDIFGLGEGHGRSWRQGEETVRRRTAYFSKIQNGGKS